MRFVYPWLLSVMNIIFTVKTSPLLAANTAHCAKFRWANMLAAFSNRVLKNVKRLGSRCSCSGHACAFMWEHTHTHERVELCAEGFLAKSVLKSLEGGLAICSNRLYSWPDDQMNQDRDCCCGPVQPSHAGLLQQSHRHYSSLNALLRTVLEQERLMLGNDRVVAGLLGHHAEYL